MSAKRAKKLGGANRRGNSAAKPWLRKNWLDILVLGAWSLTLFRYWITGKLYLLLHPNYMWLANSAAIVLLAMAIFRVVQMRQPKKRQVQAPPSHTTLLPPQLSSFILLGVAVLGLIYTPQVFASDTAIQRGVSESLTMTRSQPQRFVRQTASEDRTVIDWIRTLNVYPEPDAYTGQSVKVSGFVIHPDAWPEEYLMLSRFVLTCCAADAYPVGLPVQLAVSRQAYAPDSWLEVEGKMVTATIDGQRQLTIEPTQIETIPEPPNPYEY
ncbi:TIGR03943 family protein [Leptolyngbya cf. ectocarpi LEGE 11479]|uniref:TIGR03943 family protein n=1 Tax=Leptolyngbya cf. ectocarpi LEGE 11479 TaxID=1828722 RepID=A0A928ZTU3_LEPEC|nr:TIGR03943 family protein [Leptolyngbya ectocarpi]MBE9067274.1 TIGR03943 family protein [Leptolyngbya cf. ectocarpi LEGE 11479]